MFFEVSCRGLCKLTKAEIPSREVIQELVTRQLVYRHASNSKAILLQEYYGIGSHRIANWLEACPEYIRVLQQFEPKAQFPESRLIFENLPLIDAGNLSEEVLRVKEGSSESSSICMKIVE